MANHWWAFAIAAVATFALGVVGFASYRGTDDLSVLDCAYLSLQLFVLESGAITGPAPWSLELARFLAPALAAYAIGAVILRFARDEVVGLRSRFRHDHVVVCGLERGAALAQQLHDEGAAVVAVERNADHPEVNACRDRHILVVIGDAREVRVLRRAGVGRARQVFVLGDDDATNMKVAQQIQRLVDDDAADRAADREPVQVLVHVADAQLAGRLAAHELGRTHRTGVRLDFFDIYSSGARALLRQFPEALTPRPLPPHIGIVGLGRLGTQLVAQAGRNWLADGHGNDARLRITVADVDASQRLSWLQRRHPFLATTCELRPVELPQDPGWLVDAATFSHDDWPAVSCVFVCWPDDAPGLGISLALRELLDPEVPVVVRTYDPDLAALLPVDAADLHVFDQVQQVCRPDEIVAGPHEHLARSFHDAYIRQRLAVGDDPTTNPSMTTWSRLPDAKKQSNRAQAQALGAKLAAVGRRLAPLRDPDAEQSGLDAGELEALAELEHRRWCDAAPADDPDNVPWSELPEERREIDRIFIRRLPALLATVGLQIERSAEPKRAGPPGPGALRSGDMDGPLVSTAWLASHLEDPNVRVVDSRWYLAPFDLRDPDVEYARGHIPGAVQLRWDRDYHDPDNPIAGMLADRDRFAAAMGRAGIGDDTIVVAYDDNHVTVAARLWWALRTHGHDAVRVLDGGYDRWVAERRPVSVEPVAVEPAKFISRFRPELYASKADVFAAIDDPETQLVDGRMEGAYRNDGGSIPQSIRHPGIEFVSPSGDWPDPDTARSRLGEALDSQRVIAYCTGGVGACGTALAFAIAGRDDVAVYDGSWTEWSADPTMPREPTGEDTP